MPRPPTDRQLEEAAAAQAEDARRSLSRLYLAEIDLVNEAFLDAPDERPNSGQREGEVDHAEVNHVIRTSEKTVIFGQQMRLRAGLLLKEDERLPRFHAGHDVVRWFYGAIRLIPDYLLDAIFERGISVTMVKDRDLLVYHDPRRHQSFHTGRTRRTIYVPEGVLMAAFERGYHPWAFAEVLIAEAWKLLDYYLIVELARRLQTWMHGHLGVPGFYFVKDTLLSLNKHRRVIGEQETTVRHTFRRNSKRARRRHSKKTYDEYDARSTDTEFMQYFRHYYWDFYGWGRPSDENRVSDTVPVQLQGKIATGDILLRDPYLVGNETFAERREAAWASLKIESIRSAFGYPEQYHVDRDIVHPLVFDTARERGQPLAPASVEELVHDLIDAARFETALEATVVPLLSQLVDAGLPGIAAFYEAVAEEHATGLRYLTEVAEDYDIVDAFRQQIQARSSTPPMGLPNSVSNDARDYAAARMLRQIGKELEGFVDLPTRERQEGRHYLRTLTLKALELARPDLDEATREEMVEPKPHAGAVQHVEALAGLADDVLRRLPPEREPDLLYDILRKMDRHESYHEQLLQQARQLRDDPALTWEGGSPKAVISDLRSLVPADAHRQSSDPAGVRARWNRFTYLSRHGQDEEEQIVLLAGLVIRLDRMDGYDSAVERVIAAGDAALPALREAVRAIDDSQPYRKTIREGARRALAAVQSAAPTGRLAG
jgi:hypothetical protein